MLIGWLPVTLGILMMIPGIGEIVTVILMPTPFLKMFFKSIVVRMPAAVFLILVGIGLLII